MLVTMCLGLVRYQFQRLDFLPQDLNDRGEIVGHKQSYLKGEIHRSAVFFVNGRNVKLGDYGGAGSAVAVNNRGHVLISCREDALPSLLRPKNRVQRYENALLIWAGGKTTFLGFYYPSQRLLDNDTFIAMHGHRFEVIRVVRGKPIRVPVPEIPSRVPNERNETELYDLNREGTLIGMTSYGTGYRHAIRIDAKGRLTDLHPSIDLDSNWIPKFINSSGHIWGQVFFSEAVGAPPAASILRGGKFVDLSPNASLAYIASTSFNDADQATGNLSLFDSGSTAAQLMNKELYPPYIATPTTHAVLWDKDKFYDLNDLVELPKGCVLVTTTKINQKGWIVGSAIQDGKRFGYLLRPIKSSP